MTSQSNLGKATVGMMERVANLSTLGMATPIHLRIWRKRFRGREEFITRSGYWANLTRIYTAATRDGGTLAGAHAQDGQGPEDWHVKRRSDRRLSAEIEAK